MGHRKFGQGTLNLCPLSLRMLQLVNLGVELNVCAILALETTYHGFDFVKVLAWIADLERSLES